MKRLALAILSFILFFYLNMGTVSHAVPASTLFCQETAVFEPHGTPSATGGSYLMNMTMAFGATATQSYDVTFSSPALLSEFTYHTIGVTASHTQIVEADSVRLNVAVGYYDDAGVYHIYDEQASDYLELDSASSYFAISVNMHLLTGQRLLVRMYLSGGSFSGGYSVFWGDQGHISAVSYEGGAEYVPEFSSSPLLTLFMTTLLLVIVVYKRRIR